MSPVGLVRSGLCRGHVAWSGRKWPPPRPPRPPRPDRPACPSGTPVCRVSRLHGLCSARSLSEMEPTRWPTTHAAPESSCGHRQTVLGLAGLVCSVGKASKIFIPIHSLMYFRYFSSWADCSCGLSQVAFQEGGVRRMSRRAIASRVRGFVRGRPGGRVAGLIVPSAWRQPVSSEACGVRASEVVLPRAVFCSCQGRIPASRLPRVPRAREP